MVVGAGVGEDVGDETTEAVDFFADFFEAFACDFWFGTEGAGGEFEVECHVGQRSAEFV